MEATILDTNFEVVGVIDSYKSFIWTDRYNEAGDFEIYIPIKHSIPDTIRKRYYLYSDKSEHMMEIETIGITTDVEEETCFSISGRSLESIIDRRIVWYKKVFIRDAETGEKPNLQNGIRTLLEENVINPINEARKIPNFVFEESDDEKITSLTFEGEYLGDNLYDVISKLCKEKEIGFKITLSNDKKFIFKLVAGVDHSYGEDGKEQLSNTYVVFSPDYENLLNTNYIDSDEKWKNVTLVVGECEYDADGNVVSRVDFELGSSTGLDRREIYTDATSLSMEDETGSVISAERYKALLKQKGIDTLIDNTASMAFDGEVDSSHTYEYGIDKDYYMGDIVQIINEYGQEGRARITEYIMSCDEGGIGTYPTFTILQKGVYDE